MADIADSIKQGPPSNSPESSTKKHGEKDSFKKNDFSSESKTPNSDATNKFQESGNPRGNNVAERKQAIDEQKQAALINDGAARPASKLTSDGQKLNGIEQYDQSTKQREFLAKNDNGTYTRYIQKDDNTLHGPNGEVITLKNKQAQREQQEQQNHSVQQHQAERVQSVEPKSNADVPKNPTPTSSQMLQRESASSVQRDSNSSAQGIALNGDIRLTNTQQQNKSYDLSTEGVRVRDSQQKSLESMREPFSAQSQSTDKSRTANSQVNAEDSGRKVPHFDQNRSGHVHSAEGIVEAKQPHSRSENSSKSENSPGQYLDRSKHVEEKGIARAEHLHPARIESTDHKLDTISKKDLDLGLSKKDLLDPKGNQINVAPRVDVIDKINGPIGNILGPKDAISTIKDGTSIILIAGARVIDGVKGSIAQIKNSDALTNDKTDKVKGDISQARVSRLEDLRALTMKSPEAREQGSKIAQNILNQADIKPTGKAATAVADAMRQLSDGQLKFVDKVLTFGLKPDFSRFDDKAQIKLLAVFVALADFGKGDINAKRPETNKKHNPVDNVGSAGGKNVPVLGEKLVPLSSISKRTNEKPNDNDSKTATAKTTDKLPNPRSFIESRLELLQNCGLLKPLKEIIAKFGESLAPAKANSTERQDKSSSKQAPSNDKHHLPESKSVPRPTETPTKALVNEVTSHVASNIGRFVAQNKKNADENKTPESNKAPLQTKVSEIDRQIPTRQNEPRNIEEKTRPLGNAATRQLESANGRHVEIIQNALSKSESNNPSKINTDHTTPIYLESDSTKILISAKQKSPQERLDSDDAVKEKRNRNRSKRRTKLRCIVKEGDNLKAISSRYFGDDSYAPIVYHINKSIIQCHSFDSKQYAVLEPNSIIVIPDDEDVLSFRESGVRYDDIDFGGILAAHMEAAKQKLLSEQTSSEQQDSTVQQKVDTQTLASTRQNDILLRYKPQGPVSELLATGIKIIESECFNTDEQGVRVSLRMQHQSQWFTVCYYEIYSTESKRRQYYKDSKFVEKQISLPPAVVKTMAAQDFRKNFRKICDEFLASSKSR